VTESAFSLNLRKRMETTDFSDDTDPPKTRKDDPRHSEGVRIRAQEHRNTFLTQNGRMEGPRTTRTTRNQNELKKPNGLSKEGTVLVFGIFGKRFSFRVFSCRVSGQSILVSRLIRVIRVIREIRGNSIPGFSVMGSGLLLENRCSKGTRFPDASYPISGCGGQAGPVWTEGKDARRGKWTSQLLEARAVVEVPQADD